MESIQRSLMLLKPGESSMVEHGKKPGTLRLETIPQGVSLSMKTECLKSGEYSVYLFLEDGKERFAGNIADGSLFATLYDVRLENILGAAVVYSKNGSHSFCLKSTGMDWPSAISRFRITHAVKKKPVPGTFQPISQQEKKAESQPPSDIEKITLKDVEEKAAQEAQLEKEALESLNEESHQMYTEDGGEPKQTVDAQENTHEFCDSCPHVIKQDKINPFPTVFPNSEWVKISYPGPTGWWHYISGTIYKDSTVVAKVLGVPGEYGMAPPIWLEGFGTYMRCVTEDARGYWLMFQDAETGEVLDPALSPHDE